MSETLTASDPKVSTVKTKVEGEEVSVEVTWGNRPANFEEIVNLWGQETVYDMALRAGTTAYQNAVRNALKRGDAPESIQEAFANFVPAQPRPRANRSANALLKRFATLSAEEQQALILQLQEQAASTNGTDNADDEDFEDMDGDFS